MLALPAEQLDHIIVETITGVMTWNNLVLRHDHYVSLSLALALVDFMPLKLCSNDAISR